MLFRPALRSASPGTAVHAVAEEGVPLRDIAEAIGFRLGLPSVSLPARRPSRPGLIADIDAGRYFEDAA